MRIQKTLSAAVGMTFISIVCAAATTVIQMDLRDLTANAELIFIGTVIDIRSEREPQTIYTYVTFSDLQVVKGTHLQKTIEVRLSGGTVAGETVHVSGMPEFVVGEKSLIFLAGNFQQICPIVGWRQGRFKIRWDGVSGQEQVFDDADVPVADIRGADIVRARRIKSRQGSPGVPDTGIADAIEADELETRVSVGRFLSAIATTMGISGSQQKAPNRPKPSRGKSSIRGR